MRTEYLQQLKDRGLLAELYREGVINEKPMVLLETRHKVDDLMRAGKSHGEAVRITASLLSVSRRTIYNRLKGKRS